jgi:hypothetical protein
METKHTDILKDDNLHARSDAFSRKCGKLRIKK